MWLYFKEESNIILDIVDFKLNTPIFIKHINLFLSIHVTSNIVDFYQDDDKLGCQSWIIEQDSDDKDIYFIKNCFLRDDSAQYLGSPNLNQRVFLYTSKNRFTRWNILKVSSDKYIFKYAGVKFNKNEHTIVVSRYNENIDWLLPYNDCLTVYNKGSDDISGFNTVIKLKNIGREGHTYLDHIIKSYNNLANRVTFLQGDSLPHNNTILYGLDNYDKFLEFQPLGLRWLEQNQIPPNNLINKYKTITSYGLHYLVIKIINNLDYSQEYFFFDEGVINTKNRYIETYKLKDDKIIDHFLSRSKYPIKKPTDLINYSWSGLFSVSRQTILKHDVVTFKRILEQLTFSHPQGGADGYVLEKLWAYIFE